MCGEGGIYAAAVLAESLGVSILYATLTLESIPSPWRVVDHLMLWTGVYDATIPLVLLMKDWRDCEHATKKARIFCMLCVFRCICLGYLNLRGCSEVSPLPATCIIALAGYAPFSLLLCILFLGSLLLSLMHGLTAIGLCPPEDTAVAPIRALSTASPISTTGLRNTVTQGEVAGEEGKTYDEPGEAAAVTSEVPVGSIQIVVYENGEEQSELCEQGEQLCEPTVHEA